jgi:hypothetical protein
MSRVSKWHLSLPLFFVAWLFMTTLFGVAAPNLGSDWLPAGFAAGLLPMMPGISFIKWIGVFDWYNSHTTMQGVTFLIASALLNFLLYWVINVVSFTLWKIAMNHWRRLT